MEKIDDAVQRYKGTVVFADRPVSRAHDDKKDREDNETHELYSFSSYLKAGKGRLRIQLWNATHRIN